MKSMTDLLSVIVLSYKNGSLLFETLDSIMSQDYSSIEIIICDDASPDFEKSQIEHYLKNNIRDNIKNIHIHVNKNNLGTVKNLNIGIAFAKGEYIKAIAGDDCYPTCDVFSKQVNYLVNSSNDYFVVGNSVECDELMQPIKENGFSYKNGNELLCDYDSLLKYICRVNQNALATQAICFKKNFFEEYGFYDEDFKLIEDLPMAVRIVTNHVPFGYMNFSCIKHRGKVGVSTSNRAIDPKRTAYYEDLEKYFRLCLIPNRKIIGVLFVTMRHKVSKFRVEYSRINPSSKSKKIGLCFKYIIPLFYYAVTKSRRVFFYLKK